MEELYKEALEFGRELGTGARRQNTHRACHKCIRRKGARWHMPTGVGCQRVTVVQQFWCGCSMQPWARTTQSRGEQDPGYSSSEGPHPITVGHICRQRRAMHRCRHSLALVTTPDTLWPKSFQGTPPTCHLHRLAGPSDRGCWCWTTVHSCLSGRAKHSPSSLLATNTSQGTMNGSRTGLPHGTKGTEGGHATVGQWKRRKRGVCGPA